MLICYKGTFLYYVLLLHRATKKRSDMSPEELAAMEKEEFATGPLRILNESVKNNTQVHWKSGSFDF